MNIALPSKRYIIGIVTLVLLVALAFGLQWLVRFVEQRKQVRTLERQTQLESIINTRTELGLKVLAQVDTDGDGLLDWKEALWQTDPNNPDTDGNGVLDGEQIALIEDKLQSENKTTTKTTTPTDELARDIYTTVTVLQQSGQLDSATSDRLSTEIASAIADAIPVKTYETSDITIVSDTPESRVRYQSQLTAILSGIATQDFTTILEPTLVSNPKDVDPTKTAAVVQKYNTMLTKLLAMPVPSRVSSSHIELLNTMSRLAANIEAIANSKDDPMAGLAGVTQLQATIDKLVAIMSA